MGRVPCRLVSYYRLAIGLSIIVYTTLSKLIKRYAIFSHRISWSVKDTCVDGGKFEVSEALDAHRDGKGDNGNVEPNEKTHEPDD